MKLEDLLMNTQEEHRRRCQLEDEVAELQDVLEKEQKLNGVLQKALRNGIYKSMKIRGFSTTGISSQVHLLLAELAMVEEEIVHLEGRVKELRLRLYEEGKKTETLKLRRPRGRFLRKLNRNKGFSETRHRQFLEINRRVARRLPVNGISKPLQKSASEATSSNSESEGSNGFSLKSQTTEEESPEKGPNELSEELVKCLISIFHTMNETSGKSSVDQLTFLPKISLSCISSKGSTSKPNFGCKTSTYRSDEAVPEIHGAAGETGSYKNLVSVTRSSLDIDRMNQCYVSIGNLRKFIHRLRNVDLAFLKYKQKLAFWINVYNACIMNAFLQHDLPSSSEKLLELLNKAALNVGGIVLNALAIEHFILRQQPSRSKLHPFGLNYPEPNITFALCRGTWSSPALRVYTAENVVDELEKAKTEYLEASVHVTSRRRILLPKLLYWHMNDFADDVESLVEWVYSQLRTSAPLKKSMMECLKRNRTQEIGKVVEIQPYDPDFRYLIPSQDSPGLCFSP